MTKLPIPIYLLGLALSGMVHAQPAQVVTWANIGDRVRAQNPELKAARHLIDEALGRLRQSGRLSNPELEFEIEQDFRLREGTLDVGISQRFPVTARLALEKSVQLSEWQAAQAEVRDVERRLVAEASLALVQALAARERRTLLGQQLEVCDRQSAMLEAAAQRGEIPASAAGLARIEAAGTRLQLAQLKARETALAIELKRLLGIGPGTGVEPSGRLPEPAKVNSPVHPERRPDYEMARIGAEAAAVQVELEKARRYDDVEAGGFLSAMRREDAPEGYQEDVMVGIKLSIPLPLHNDNRGAIEEAKARELRLKQELEAKSQAIVLEVAAEHAAMGEWGELIDRIDREMLPLADEQLRLAEEALRIGQGDVETLLRVTDARFELLLSKLEAQEEFHLARVRHQAALGNF